MDALRDGGAYLWQVGVWWFALITTVLGLNELSEFLFRKSIKPIHRNRWRTAIILLMTAQTLVFSDLKRTHTVTVGERNALRGQVSALEKANQQKIPPATPSPVSFSLGGSATDFKNGPVDSVDEKWVPVSGHQNVELDWSRFQNAEVIAEITIWVKNRPNSGGFSGMARIWNTTDGVAVTSTRQMLEEETPTRISLGVPPERTTKIYRLEVKASTYAMVTASGDLIVRPR